MRVDAWRVGSKIPINVYDGDRPVCQCHNAEDAARIIAAIERETPRRPHKGDGAFTRDTFWCECGRGMSADGVWNYCPRCGHPLEVADADPS